ncbi:MAG: type transport system ATP-binding protein and permease [Labilithrix sp.]|nr:type transport system ATP-binding protein and permease [Labilithrix sp.]
MSAQPSPGAGMRGGMRMGGGIGNIARAKNPRGTLARLVMYFGDYRARLYVVGVTIVVYTLLGLVGPYLMGVALDRYIATKDAEGLAHIALLMLAAFLANNLFQGISSWLMAGISQRALKKLRRDLFRHVQTLPMGFFERTSSGELMSRLTNDIDAVNQAVAQNVTSLLASVLSMAGILVAMFVLDRWLAIASLLVVPIMMWFTRFVAVFTRKGFTELQKHLGRLNGIMEESIGAQKIVTVFRRNESVLEKFRTENENVYRAGIYANTYALLLMPLTTVLGNLFVIVLAGLGGWLALQGLVSVGIIATFINYGQNFVAPLRQLSNLYNTLQAALAGAERVFEILDTPSESDDARAPRKLPAVRGEVRFDHVTFGYRPGTTVIDDMSLEAKPGQIVALVGPTGAGKTTIINLLTRFYEIDRGTIAIDGTDIRDLKKSDLRRMLGLVLQDTYLFGASVMENIRYGRLDATDDDVIRAAQMADADHFIRQLPDGYQTVLSERAGNLSQGQRQLLAIARTLLAQPSILILDEATSSIDTRTEARIQRSLLRLMEGRTSFVIAHRLSTIRDADQVLVVDAGKIVERGTHDTLLERHGLYHQLYTSQFKGHAL